MLCSVPRSTEHGSGLEFPSLPYAILILCVYEPINLRDFRRNLMTCSSKLHLLRLHIKEMIVLVAACIRLLPAGCIEGSAALCNVIYKGIAVQGTL